MEDSKAAAPPELVSEAYESLAEIIRDWNLDADGTDVGQQEQEESPVARDPVIKNMVAAGRAYLEANPDRDADDYGVKQVMARVEPKHDAVQSLHALSALGQEYKTRKEKR